MARMQKITPCLWFNSDADNAAKFYCSLFKNSKIISSSPVVVSFELDGIQFTALNGGPQYAFSEAISFVIECENQNEVDHFWENLTANGGEESQCGWLKDRFGVSWQVIPARFMEMMKTGSPEQVHRIMNIVMGMKKFNIEHLEAVFS